MGHEVCDGAGEPVGRVVDTYPFDGGDVELVVVRLDGAFGERRMLSVEDVFWDGLSVRSNYARWQIEDSPGLSSGRHAADDPYRAKAYWTFEEPAGLLRAA